MPTAYDDGYGQPQPQISFPPFDGWIKRLVILNVGIFLAHFFLGFVSKDAQQWVTGWLGLNSEHWRSFPAVWQLVTSGFLHSTVQLQHVVMNMLFLWMFGSMVQSAIGERRFIAHYLIAIVASGVGHLLYSFVAGVYGPAVGASGAVTAFIVAAAVMNPNAPVIFIIVRLKLWILAAIIVAFDLFALLREMQGGPKDMVAHSVHLAGALYGYVAARRRWLWKDPLAVFERKRAVARAQKQISDDARMDAILQKINREGIGSLTRSEKTFLQKQTDRRKSG